MIKNLKHTLFSLLFVATTNLHAETVVCPDVNVIQNAAPAINIAVKDQELYTIYSEDYVYNKDNFYWRVGAKSLLASSDEEALQKGKEIVKHASIKKQKDATQIYPNEYICSYGPQDVYALGFKFKK